MSRQRISNSGGGSRTGISRLSDNRNFFRLAATQFLGTINDHLFKMVVALYAITAASQPEGSEYLSLSGALFVLPYLLFSGYAGRLADLYEKRSVLVTVKFFEIVIMALGMLALCVGTGIKGLLIVLFLMATQSTFFSPSKFGYIPEIVPSEQLIRANGMLEAMRYSAVILGTLAGSLLMQFWGESPLQIGMVMVLIALAGFGFCFGLRRQSRGGRPGGGSSQRYEYLAGGFRRIARSETLTISVASITFFEMTATLALLDILLLAKNSLEVSDGLAGLLPAFGAIGGGFGTYVCGRISGFRVNLGLSPIAGVILAVTLLAAAMVSWNYIALAIALSFVGFFGGMFFVPYLTWLQKAPGDTERGLVISTNNFLNMAGVLAASGALWMLHDFIGLKPQTILLICAAMTALFVSLTLAVSAHVRKRACQLTLRWSRDSTRFVSRYLNISGVPRRFIGRHMRIHAATTFPYSKWVISGMALLGLLCSATLVLANEQTSRSMFRIEHELWGEIGTLTQEVSFDGPAQRVDTNVNVRVMLIGIQLYRVEAEWLEEWRGGELYRFSGTTRTNSDIKRVTGARYPDGFRIDTPDSKLVAPFAVQPVIPRSLGFVNASIFMSPETGRITHSRFVEGEPRQIEFGDGSLAVRAFRAYTEGEHSVYFDCSGQLVQFEYAEALGKVTVTRFLDMNKGVVPEFQCD